MSEAAIPVGHTALVVVIFRTISSIRMGLMAGRGRARLKLPLYRSG